MEYRNLIVGFLTGFFGDEAVKTIECIEKSRFYTEIIQAYN